MSIESGPQFLSDRFNLHKIPEVDQSVQQLRREGEKFPDTKEQRIAALWRRIDRAVSRYRELFTSRLKERLINHYTLQLEREDGSEDDEKIDKLVQGLFESEKAILERRGYGAELQEYDDRPSMEDYEKYKDQLYAKKAEQERTLSVWLDYFASPEVDHYPLWFKYLALRSLQKMGARDRDTNTYSKRSANTIQPFPDRSSEALARVLDVIKANEDKTLRTQGGERTPEEEQALVYLEELANK